MRRVWLASIAAALLIAIPGSASASTYTNPNLISIPEGTGPATPYPSTLTVTDLPGAVTRVRATLNNLSHGWPNNLEVLLVAPDGRYTILMADVCGTSDTEIVNQTFTFDDAAAAELPEAALCPGGTYRPSFPDSGDLDLPPPAPQDDDPPSAMSALNGTAASGTWQLFAFDEACCDDPPPENQIAGGWTLDLLTDATCSGNAATLTGTAGDDELIGTDGGDVILGFGGNDTIQGLGGNDVICGGDANDNIRGGLGDDRLIGQAAKDTLRGQGGKDTLLGKGGKDKLNGGTSKDVCKGGKKDDTAKKCEVEKSV